MCRLYLTLFTNTKWQSRNSALVHIVSIFFQDKFQIRSAFLLNNLFLQVPV